MSEWIRNFGRVLWRAIRKYAETDGEQRAASFAYYAFFAMFPLLLLFVSIGSQFVKQEDVSVQVIEFVGKYVPVVLEEPGKQSLVFDAINGVLKTPKRAGVLAPAILNSVEAYTWRQKITFGVIGASFRLARLSIPTLVLFYGFSMFYKFAPRGARLFSQIWVAATVVTFALQA